MYTQYTSMGFEMERNQKLKHKTLVWANIKGMENWAAAGSIGKLPPLFSGSPPLPDEYTAAYRKAGHRGQTAPQRKNDMKRLFHRNDDEHIKSKRRGFKREGD
jgi:hypothetical protein